ncbi:hypothetical protein K1719_021721 [Acacia pycnantha]|nr:hypothetical protein K1719_021721 [Acacia pycnantha]
MSGINQNIPVAFKQEVVYKECLHNHAASLGKVARDGCYEFLQPNIDSGLPEAALLCAVCNCHRNFHRKQVIYTPIMTVDTETSPPQTQQQPDFPAEATMAAAAEENADNAMAVEVAPPPQQPQQRRKRKTRTKFTDEQVSRLKSFAQGLGWTSKSAGKEEILNFCSEVGISRRKLVVWLNNNRRRQNANLHQADNEN